MILLGSALGTLVAAVSAALIGRRIASRLDIPTLWIVGLFSPLLFDSAWVIAHSLAAALATTAVLAAVRVIEERRLRCLAVVTTATSAMVLLRTEGLVFAAGLALASVAATARRPDRRRYGLVVGLVATVSALSGVAIDKVWYLQVSDGVVDGGLSVLAAGVLRRRQARRNLELTLAAPDGGDNDRRKPSQVVLVASGVLGAAVTRWRPERRPLSVPQPWWPWRVRS